MRRTGAWPLACLATGLLIPVAACTNDGDATDELPTWRFEEELRIGGADTGPSSFNDIRGIAVDSAGRIFVLDGQSQDIRVFDSAGGYIRTIGRTGRGPGEFVLANGVAFLPDGNLMVYDARADRVTTFDSAGNIVATHPLPIRRFGYLWGGTVDTAGRIIDVIRMPGPDGELRLRRTALATGSADTVPVYPCGEPAVQGYELPRGVAGVPFAGGPTFTFGPRGYTWCADTREYAILQRRIGSPDTVRVIRGSTTAVPVTDAERDSAIAGVRDFMKEAGEADVDWSLIPEQKPPLEGFETDAEGRLWVRLTTAEPGTRFDIFDSTGAQIATGLAPVEIPSYWHPLVAGGHLYTLVRDSLDVPAVVRLGIDRE